MARLVGEGSTLNPDTEVRVRSLNETSAADVLWCDGLAADSPTNMGILSWKMKRFWDETMRSHWMRIATYIHGKREQHPQTKLAQRMRP